MVLVRILLLLKVIMESVLLYIAFFLSPLVGSERAVSSVAAAVSMGPLVLCLLEKEGSFVVSRPVSCFLFWSGLCCVILQFQSHPFHWILHFYLPKLIINSYFKHAHTLT